MPTTCSPSGIGKVRVSRDSNSQLAVHLIRCRGRRRSTATIRKTLRHTIFLRSGGMAKRSTRRMITESSILCWPGSAVDLAPEATLTVLLSSSNAIG
jgi:hypothetical protein